MGATPIADENLRCRKCSSPFAAQQRYCLGCGKRNPAVPVPAAAGPILAALGVAGAAGGEPPVVTPAPVSAVAGADSSASGAMLARFGTKPLGAIALSLLASGTLIGAAFAPPAAQTLAAARRVIIIEGPATAAKGPAALPLLPPVVTPAPAPVVPMPLGQLPVPQPAPTPDPTPTPQPPVPPVPPVPGPTIGHSFVVLLPGDDASLTAAPAQPPLSRDGRGRGRGRGTFAHAAEAASNSYLKDQLVPTGALLTNFQQVSASSVANRIAMVTGQAPNSDTLAGCTGLLKQLAPHDPYLLGAPVDSNLTGCVFSDSVGNLYNSSAVAVNVYIEAGPKVGSADLCEAPPKAGDLFVPPVDGSPDRRDNPLIWSELFTSSDCTERLRPLKQLQSDVAADAADKGCAASPAPVNNQHCLAQINFVIPSRCRVGSDSKCPDGSAAGLAPLDDFLKQTVSTQILESGQFKRNGLLMLGFTGADSAPDAAAPGPKGLLLVSPFVKPEVTDSTRYSTYDLLYTLMSRADIANSSRRDTMFGFADPRMSSSVPNPAKEFAASNYKRKLIPAVPAG